MGFQTYENPVRCDNHLYVQTSDPEGVYLWIGDDQGLSYRMPPDQVSELIQQLQSWLGKHQCPKPEEGPCCPCPHDMFPVGACDCGCHQAESEEMAMVLHPEDFFIDDSYTCKLCGYHTDEEEDFVEHILDTHEMEARASNAVFSATGPTSGVEYWDVDSIALAEEFDAS